MEKITVGMLKDGCISQETMEKILNSFMQMVVESIDLDDNPKEILKIINKVNDPELAEMLGSISMFYVKKLFTPAAWKMTMQGIHENETIKETLKLIKERHVK